MKVSDNGQYGLRLFSREEIEALSPAEMAERKRIIEDHLHNVSKRMRAIRDELSDLTASHHLWWKQKEALERRLTEVKVVAPKREKGPTKREKTIKIELDLTTYLASLSNEELEDLVERLKEEGRYE